MSNSSLIIDKASIHMNLFRNKSSKVTWPCNQIKMDDKEFKCKGKKQTGSKKVPSILRYFKHDSIYCDSNKFYIWEKLHNELI